MVSWAMVGETSQRTPNSDGSFRCGTRPPLCAWLLAGLTVLALGGCGRKEKPQPDSAAANPREIVTPTGVTMVLVPGGQFVMGDDAGEEDERPGHVVRVQSFYMDKCEVTQAAYQKLMGRNPSKFQGADRPVEQVSWLAAVKYCNMRSLREGLKPCYDAATFACDFTADAYRLPTEAEWEYACRVATAARYSFGNDPSQLREHAWFADNSNGQPQPVGQKRPNAWALCDMHGNVAEWCQDFYGEAHYREGAFEDPTGPDAGQERVLRGGSWRSTADACRSSARYSEAPGLADVCFGYDAYGFRCVKRAARPRIQRPGHVE